MELFEQDNQPTLMRHIYERLIGENVFVYAKGQDHSFAGKLAGYNGYTLHIVGTNDVHYYMHVVDVAVIGSEK